MGWLRPPHCCHGCGVSAHNVTASAAAGYVELRVIDHGPGIPEQDWDKVFLPFQRLGDHDNDTGVGLGLALSRGLAEAMGGTLQPESAPKAGITMILRLPAAAATERELRAGHHNEPDDITESVGTTEPGSTVA